MSRISTIIEHGPSFLLGLLFGRYDVGSGYRSGSVCLRIHWRDSTWYHEHRGGLFGTSNPSRRDEFIPYTPTGQTLLRFGCRLNGVNL